MSILGLEALFAPKRIAVFDVSDEEGTRGAEIFKPFGIHCYLSGCHAFVAGIMGGQRNKDRLRV